MLKVLVCQVNPIVGDIEGNAQKILDSLEKGKSLDADLFLFPELCLTGYPPEDFVLLPHFVTAVEKALDKIVSASKGITAIVGTIRRNTIKSVKPLCNSAAVISNGKLLGFQDKTLLPTYDVFSELRYFEPASENKIWDINGKKVAITICEDIWSSSDQLEFTSYEINPLTAIKEKKPDLLLNLSASPWSLGKTRRRFKVGAAASQYVGCPLILCNQVGGNDNLIFDGFSFYVTPDGKLLDIAKGFEEDWLFVDTSAKKEEKVFSFPDMEKLFRALVLGVRDYFHKSGFHKACFGLSGGIDSALVACIAAEALGKENVLAVIMPSRYSSEGSVTDSEKLARNLGIETKKISIEEPFNSYLNLLKPHFHDLPFDNTEENLQARIRAMILMALSNKLGYVVLSTGNKSELAMGYATLYGDMCGGLGVISDLTKRHVYTLSRWINRNGEIIPETILKKEPSAELKENQKDSDSLPPYDIIDNVVTSYVEEHMTPEDIVKKYGYDPELVHKLIVKIHSNEYKRRQSPPGLRVSEKAFSVGRRFPIVQGWV